MMSEGIISQVDPGQHRFQILSDGETAPGGSGGPLLNKDGSYVGLVLNIDSQTGNFVGVLPSWKFLHLLD